MLLTFALNQRGQYNGPKTIINLVYNEAIRRIDAHPFSLTKSHQSDEER